MLNSRVQILCETNQDSISDQNTKKFIAEVKWTSSKSRHHPPQLSKGPKFPALLSEFFVSVLLMLFFSAYSRSLSITNYFLLLCPLREEPVSAKPLDEFGISLLLHVTFNNGMQ